VHELTDPLVFERGNRELMRIEGGAVQTGWSDQGQDLGAATVQIGETSLSQVAARLGIPTQTLQNANPQIANPHGLTAGVELHLPSPNGGAPAAANASVDAPAGISALATSKRMESNVDSILAKTALSSAFSNPASADAATSPVGELPHEAPAVDPLNEGYTPAVKQDLIDKMRGIYQSPQFQALSSPEKNSVLQTLASNPPLTQDKITQTLNLLGSLASLSPGDRQLALDGFRATHADPAYAASLKTLVDDPKFTSLSGAEKTAVLSQAKNYPDATTIGNIDRLLQKDWFQNQTLDDKQCSLKTIARFSHNPDGDRQIINNTLDKFLSPASDFKLQWKNIGDGVYGEAANKVLTLSTEYIHPGNDKIPQNEDNDRLSLNTVAHEVNHLMNHDVPANTFQYFQAEYRAWYVGFQAQHGRPPTNEEAVNQRLRDQISPDTFYGPYTAAAAADPVEGPKLFDFLKSVTGMNVDAHNWRQVVNNSNPDHWPNLSTSPAPAPVGNNDNH
jgi:hypothetical protein